MLGSLRFRLPALFLLGVVLSGLVASLIAIRFFQSYTHTRAVAELRSESVGIVQLYARQAGAATVPLPRLEQAIGGDRIYFVPAFRGAQLFQPIPPLPANTINLLGAQDAAARRRWTFAFGTGTTSPSRSRSSSATSSSARSSSRSRRRSCAAAG